MGRKGKLYYLEHRLLPEMFYGGDRETIKKLSDSKYYSGVVEELNRKDHKEEITLKEEDFTVTGGTIKGTDALILKIDMPEPNEAPLCRTVYMLCSNDMQERAYYTVERYENGTYGLCGWLAPNMHVGFEMGIDYSPLGERLKAQELFRELPEKKKELLEIMEQYNNH